MTITNTEKKENEKAVLCGLQTTESDARFERRMEELAMLSKSCGIDALLTMTQRAETPTRATYIGSGKVRELKAVIEEMDAELAVFDDTLSPMQFRNLQKELGVPVIDRTALILRIFSDQARTREARLQVEHANLQYIMPRLAGMWTHFGRQGGSSGSMSNRGVGETQLELDRRHIERRMAELEKELKKIDKERTAQRSKRLSSPLPKVSLVGYTNAGKSTMMNKLLDLSNKVEEKKVLEKDALFATLDTTVRKIDIKGNKPFLLSDTVGFIDELPHSLVKAFRSTLEEVEFAALLIQVIDVSDPDSKVCMEVTAKTLKEIGAGSIPMLIVFNKTDKADNIPFPVPVRRGNEIYMSAKSTEGLELLIEAIDEMLKEGREEKSFVLPYDKAKEVERLRASGDLISADYREDGIYVTATI